MDFNSGSAGLQCHGASDRYNIVCDRQRANLNDCASGTKDGQGTPAMLKLIDARPSKRCGYFAQGDRMDGSATRACHNCWCDTEISNAAGTGTNDCIPSGCVKYRAQL